MRIYLASFIAINFLGLLYRATLQKISIYVGNNIHTHSAVKINAYPDILFNGTIISSNDFTCTSENGCLLQPGVQELSFYGVQHSYQIAYVQLNLIKKPFDKPSKVFYLINDSYNIGSIVGFYRSSEFFNYLYQADKNAGYRIVFRLDSSNTLTFKEGVYQIDKLDVEYDFETNVNFSDRPSMQLTGLKFCLTNKLDRNSGATYFGVPNQQFEKWERIISSGLENANKDTGGPLKYHVKFFMNLKGKSIGDMIFSYSELYEDGVLKIKGFDPAFDEGRNCDVYTGTLLLKKFNFKFYYVEYPDSYRVTFGYDNFHGWEDNTLDRTKVKEGSSIIKVFFLILIIAICGFGFYYFMDKNKIENDTSENYILHHHKKGENQESYSSSKDDKQLKIV